MDRTSTVCAAPPRAWIRIMYASEFARNLPNFLEGPGDPITNNLRLVAPLPASGLLYVGDMGTLLVPYFGKPILLNGTATAPLPKLATILPRTQLSTKGPNPLAVAQHQREWIDACHGGPPPLSPFSYAGPLTETVLLGTIAMRTGARVTWDHEQMQVTNTPAANQLVRPARRAGWHL